MVLKKTLTEAGGVEGRWKKGGREGGRKGEKERLMSSPHHM